MLSPILALVLLLGVALAAAGLAPDVAQALRSAKQIYVATRRADGAQSKVVPVWFMFDAEAIYFTTGPDSYKAKRIRKGSPMQVWVGSANGPHFEGKAELLKDTTLAERMGQHYSQKYWIAWLGLFRPSAARVASGKVVIVKIKPN
jgi:PPOX class probable F420-dependent enzyme